MNSQNTLLYIPDISGFTNFVNQTEITHSSHIISELLEILVEENDLGLSVSEIEGDAILFYKQNNIPSLQELISLSEKMFKSFHAHLKRYDYERICRCGACRNASNLSLKFIIHAGEVNVISVGNHEKLHGKDVIVAHNLLKNSIKLSEYILFTNAFSSELKSIAQSSKKLSLEKGQNTIDDEAIRFQYFDLNPLLSEIPEGKPISITLSGKLVKSKEVTINKPIDEVYFAIHDFEQRMKWNPRIRSMILKDGNLNKSGVIHQCIVDQDTLNVKTLGRVETNDSITYAERADNVFVFKRLIQSFNLKNKHGKTLIHIESDFKMKGILFVLKPLFKIALRKQTTQTLEILKQFVESKK